VNPQINKDIIKGIKNIRILLLMKVTISNKNKKDLFVALFQIIKGCTSIVRVIFQNDKMYIQGMDKSHICLFEVNIKKVWFDDYNVDELCTVCFDANIFHLIISSKQESHNIIINSDNEDNINIDLVSQEHTKGEFNKYFKIPLVDYDYDEMNIPVVEYDAEFSISSKKICEIMSQMLSFGNDLNIKCSEEKIDLVADGIVGEMLVNIPIDDLNEYSIVEGDVIDLKYSLNYIAKMCLTNKLSNELIFSISADYPMKINYDLGDESSIVFYIAPKISD
jgi:proliferating cell nuclear antigen